MPGLHWQNIRMSLLVIINDKAGEGLSDSASVFSIFGFFDLSGWEYCPILGVLGLGG